MTVNPTDPLQTLREHLDRHEGQIGTADVALGIEALKAYLCSGAAPDRGLRREIARMRPIDEQGIALTYLFVITVDGATHEGRLGPLEAYAASEAPLAAQARELLALLDSDDFRGKVGWRPTRPGDRKLS